MKTYKIIIEGKVSTIVTDSNGIIAIIEMLRTMDINCEVYEMQENGFKLVETLYKFTE